MKVGIALGGGGARGLAHIGVLKQLEKSEVKIDMIAGTSMGSIVGGLYALYHDAHKVEKIILETLNKYSDDLAFLKRSTNNSIISNNSIPDVLSRSWKYFKNFYIWNVKRTRDHWVNPRPFIRIFHDLFGDSTIQDCAIKFCAVTVDLLHGREHFITEGLLYKAVTASSALPGYFPPVTMEGKVLVDGGVLMPLPTPYLRNHTDFVIGVNLHDPYRIQSIPKNIFDISYAAERVRIDRLVYQAILQADVVISPDVKEYDWKDYDQGIHIIEAGRQSFSPMSQDIKRKIKRKRFTHLIRKGFANPSKFEGHL